MRNVVVTGASAGLGRATAVAFGKLGCNVGLLARDRDRLDAAARDVAAVGGRPLALQADVADADAVEQAADRAFAAFGPIDVWVNSAMATVFAPFDALAADEFRRVTEVTYLGCVYGTMAALKHMRARDEGTIVQVGSALAYRSIPLQSAYCGAKSAIRGFTDALRSDLLHGGSRIRLTMVQMPALNTPQFDWARNKLARRPQPVPPIYQPEPAARAIVRAAREAPRELWVGRSSVQAILGTMLAPGLLDHFVASKAYSGQMSNEPAAGGRGDNLFSPVPGAYAAHGRFDRRVAAGPLAIDPAALRRGAASALLALGFGVSAYAIARAAYRSGARGRQEDVLRLGSALPAP